MLSPHRIACLSVAAIAAASPAAPAANSCAALNELVVEARSDFPSLVQRSFAGATCAGRSQRFHCDWFFPSDAFALADSQVSKLRRCAAAYPHSEALSGKRGEAAFQVGPETALVIRGPESDSGNWNVRLEITTTAEW